MSAPAERERLQEHIARLRRRNAQQANHVEGLAEYPVLANRAEVLDQESENLRLALIQLR
jgi:hypothetical protein